MNDSTPESAPPSAGTPETGTQPHGIALYHDMRVEEDFTKCATRLFSILRTAVATSPGAPRYLYLDVQGHRNAAGEYDDDASEIMQEFLMGFLRPYLTEISTPLCHARNPEPQREDVPGFLFIRDPDREHAYDHRELRVRNRDNRPDDRRSRPSLRAIADYLGLTEPICLVCWQTPVERAHVVPKSLGGSNDVRNFALLCPRHHREAPDVADAEAFWSWVDYACQRDGRMKWEGVEPEEELAKAERVGLHIETRAPVRNSVRHFDRVRDELVRHYGWTPEDFAGGTHWVALMAEFHMVMDSATSTHFNVAKKASTEAWAFEVARRRLRDGGVEREADDERPTASSRPEADLAARTVRKSQVPRQRRCAKAGRRRAAGRHRERGGGARARDHRFGGRFRCRGCAARHRGGSGGPDRAIRKAGSGTDGARRLPALRPRHCPDRRRCLAPYRRGAHVPWLPGRQLRPKRHVGQLPRPSVEGGPPEVLSVSSHGAQARQGYARSVAGSHGID
ncbi:HNH endonuclease [Streptomyces sp. NPDC052644]